MTEFKYERKSQPYPKLEHWRERLDKILEENEALPKKQQRRMTRIWKELTNDGYDDGYDSNRRYAKKWRIEHGKQQAQAFVPLIFDPREAYQFDWSEEKVVIAGVLTTVKVAQAYEKSLSLNRPESSGVRLRGGDTLAFACNGGFGTGCLRLRAFFLPDAVSRRKSATSLGWW